MNNCKNGKKGENGECSCNSGWKGADCTLKSTTLVNGFSTELAHQGPKYFSFTSKHAEDSTSTLHLESKFPMEIYVSRNPNSDPTQFSNDAVFKSVKSLSLNSYYMDFLQKGYAVTVYVPAIDER